MIKGNDNEYLSFPSFKSKVQAFAACPSDNSSMIFIILTDSMSTSYGEQRELFCYFYFS